ncbi:MAG: aldehyde ferredoxin oxidoreductase N-terminal domain-containing protein [Syntrophaceae bacterium]
MNIFQQFFNMRICVVDLSTSSVVTIPLEMDHISSYIGGATLNRVIFQQYMDDPIVFGVGPLTGSFAPASSLLVATFKSPRFEKISHVPFMLRTGPDMKFSGIDFLVVKGTASELSVLYVDRGAVQILPAGNLWELSISDITTTLKRDFPPFQSALVTGPAADRGILHAAASVGTRGSLDKAGLASRMAEKKLKAIMFHGIGGLSFGSDNPEQGKELITRISTEKNFKHRGFVSILKKLEGGGEAGKHLRGLRKKDMACYHCPFPCMTHVDFTRRDTLQGEGQEAKEGLILLDHTGWIALDKKVGTDALPSLQSCLQSGLDPAENYAPTSEVPVKAHTLFGGGIAPIPPGDLWEKKVALAMILGICPIFLLLIPQIVEKDLLAFISPNEDILENMQKSLSSAIQSLFIM